MLSWLENKKTKQNKENKESFLLKIFFIVGLVRKACYFCTFSVYFILFYFILSHFICTTSVDDGQSMTLSHVSNLIIRLGIMSGCVTNFYILFHISLIFFSSAHSLHNDLDFERAHMVKTTGEFFTQQKKTQKD